MAACLIVVEIVGSPGLPASVGAAPGSKTAGTLVVRDAVTVPGRAVMIEARLVQTHLLRETGIGGEQLEFIVAGRKIGTAMTGGDGRALLEYTPRMRGNQAVTVRVVESPRIERAEGAATVFSWERRRPILLIDVSTLMEAGKEPAIPLPPGSGAIGIQLPTAVAEAADELKRLTDFYFNVIYLSRSGPGISPTADLRTWLREHRFPPGLFVALSSSPSALAARIEQLREDGWDNLKAGVGRTREFAEVLIQHRIQAVIVPATDQGKLPKKSVVAKNWKEVRKKIQG